MLTSLVTGQVVHRIPMEQPARALAWSPRDDLLAAGLSEAIFIFRAGQEGFEGSARDFANNLIGLDAVVFSADGNLLISHDADGLKIWNVKTARLLAKLDEKAELGSGRLSASALAFHPTKPLVAAATTDGASLRILDLSKLG
jgi:WD40 repeat protein